MAKELLETIAYENGLEYIETVTGGNNGYPSGIRGGIIGFETFDEADELAKKHGLSLCVFHKRDGWQMYERAEQPYQPLIITSEDYGDDYNQYGVDDIDDFFESQVSPMLEDFDNFEDLQKFIDNSKEIYDELLTIDETQWVITCQGKYYETVDKEAIQWGHDTHTWVIGIMEGEA